MIGKPTFGACLALAGLLLGHTAHATERTAVSLPPVLAKSLWKGQTRVGYLSDLANPFLLAAKGNEYLTPDLVRLQRAEQHEAQRIVAKVLFIGIDRDADGSATKAEIEAFVAGTNAANRTSRDLSWALMDPAAILRSDTDGDGIVTEAEWLSAMAPEGTPGWSEGYQALSSSGLGTSLFDLVGKAAAAFDAADVDGDGILSETEAAPYAEVAKAPPNRRVRPL